jgi:polysaccharide biosynthesis transport protein
MNEPAEAEHAALHAYTPPRRAAEPSYAEASGLREYAQLLWRKRAIVLVVTAICVVGTLGYCLAVKPTYEATASVLLEPPISQTLIEANFPTSVAAVPNVPDGIEVIESANVANLVDKAIPGAPSVTATQVGTTDVVQVSVRSKDPHLATVTANAYAGAYIHYEQQQTINTFTSAQAQLQNKVNTVQLAISNLNAQIKSASPTTNLAPDETQLGDLQDQLATLQDQLQNYQFYSSQGVTSEVGQVISSATVPTKPVSPKTLEWTVLALIFGLILGIGLALLVNAVSPRRHDLAYHDIGERDPR